MAQIELPNGMKITLTSKEVLEMWKDANTSNSAPRVAENKIERNIQEHHTEISSDAPVLLPVEFPTVDDIVKSLEDKGFPFAHTIFEEFANRFRTNPRQNGKLYRQFRDVLKEAVARLADQYNGHWVSKPIAINKKPSKEFWLVSNEVEKIEENNKETMDIDSN